MTDKQLISKITNKITEVNTAFLVELLGKCLKRKPLPDDSLRIKQIPVQDKKLCFMISFDDVIIGVMEGSIQVNEDQIKYLVDYIPAEDYKNAKKMD